MEEGVVCGFCKEEKATIRCLGCGVPLCNSCVRLEDYGFGCDGGKLVVFCPRCYRNPLVNTILELKP